MNLTRNAWKRRLPSTAFDDYILIIPEQSVIVSFTSMQDKEDTRVVWVCWIRQEADSIVYTAVRNAQKWRRESYGFEGGELHWNNGVGESIWTQISESEIPVALFERGQRYLDKWNALLHPPEYPNEDSSALRASP